MGETSVPTATPSAPPASAVLPRAASGRITSLDAVRGVMLLVSVGVNSLLDAPDWFEHAVWTGVHPVDLVFPVFVILSGCGLGFAMHRQVKPGPLVRRVVVLLMVGLVYNAATQNSWDLSTWRWPGVLQLYAGLVLIVSLGHLITRTWRGWLTITLTAAGAYTLLLSRWAATCSDGVLTRSCNPSGTIDTSVFGASHIYAGGVLGHDPEGLVALLGATVAAAAGATVAHLLLGARSGTGARSRRRSPRREPSVLAAAPSGSDGARSPALAIVPLLSVAVGFLVAGWLSVHAPDWLGGTPVPPMKRLWTPPFTLTVAAGVTVALLLGHLLLDRRVTAWPLRAGSWPLLALGRNSLLVYFGSHVTMAVLGYLGTGPDGKGSSLSERGAAALAIGGNPQLGWTIAALLAWTVLACLLHTRRWYLRP